MAEKPIGKSGKERNLQIQEVEQIPKSMPTHNIIKLLKANKLMKTNKETIF